MSDIDWLLKRLVTEALHENILSRRTTVKIKGEEYYVGFDYRHIPKLERCKTCGKEIQ